MRSIRRWTRNRATEPPWRRSSLLEKILRNSSPHLLKNSERARPLLSCTTANSAHTVYFYLLMIVLTQYQSLLLRRTHPVSIDMFHRTKSLIMRLDVRWSNVTRGKAEFVATPQQNNAERRSFVIVPESGSGSPSTFGVVDLASEREYSPFDAIAGASFSYSRHSTPSSIRRRSSTSPSFMNEFPSPPTPPAAVMAFSSTEAESSNAVKHSSAFGQLVTGPPGAGKTTYAHGLHQVSPPSSTGFVEEHALPTLRRNSFSPHSADPFTLSTSTPPSPTLHTPAI
jgi:hypothetical protein